MRGVDEEDEMHTLSANRYIDFGDGWGTLSSEGLTIPAPRDLRFPSEPKGAKSIAFV